MADESAPMKNPTAREFIVRVAWIVVRLMTAFYVGQSSTFFYQGF